MESNEPKSILKSWSTVLASLCYCYIVVSRIPSGKFRFFSLLPIFTVFTILPLYLPPVLPSGITAFFITWLANFKLVLYSFNQGPLSNPNLTLIDFLLIAAFPINIKRPSSQIKKPILNFWLKALLASVFVAICDVYNGRLPPFIVFLIYCVLLYLFIDVLLYICNKFVGSIMGVELLPPSDEPYVSTSLQDFWGRRWNLVVTDTLRHTVHKPTRAFMSKYMGLEWARFVAVTASFLVSGLMHELIFYYMARVSPSWEVTWFFVLHGLCVVLEVHLKRVLGRKLGLHRAISGPLAVGFVMGTGYWLFFAPLVRNHVDERTLNELMTFYKFIKESFKFK